MHMKFCTICIYMPTEKSNHDLFQPISILRKFRIVIYFYLEKKERKKV